MKRSLIAAAALAALLPATASAVPTDRTVAVAAGETKTYNGTQATGLNVNYFDQAGGNGGMVASPGTCSKNTQTYCDTTLIAFSNPVPESDADGKLSKKVTITLSDYGTAPDPATDFDLLAFGSTADATRGAELARDGDLTETGAETVTFNLITTRAQPTAYALVDVVYFAAVNGTFKATVKG